MATAGKQHGKCKRTYKQRLMVVILGLFLTEKFWILKKNDCGEMLKTAWTCLLLFEPAPFSSVRSLLGSLFTENVLSPHFCFSFPQIFGRKYWMLSEPDRFQCQISGWINFQCVSDQVMISHDNHGRDEIIGHLTSLVEKGESRDKNSLVIFTLNPLLQLASLPIAITLVHSSLEPAHI